MKQAMCNAIGIPLSSGVAFGFDLCERNVEKLIGIEIEAVAVDAQRANGRRAEDRRMRERALRSIDVDGPTPHPLILHHQFRQAFHSGRDAEYPVRAFFLAAEAPAENGDQCEEVDILLPIAPCHLLRQVSDIVRIDFQACNLLPLSRKIVHYSPRMRRGNFMDSYSKAADCGKPGASPGSWDAEFGPACAGSLKLPEDQSESILKGVLMSNPRAGFFKSILGNCSGGRAAGA
ncbi:MAG TPA: hypothetical protein VKU93_06650 [Terracidiphilus sp.]|nr:hypothetical protein [Terracidiphilus sp.]